MKSKRSFKALFWPTFIELLFFMLMGTVDTLMLSNYSDYAVGSVGNSNTLILMFAVLLLVVANGVAVLVSQYLGAKKSDVAHRVIGSGLIINLFVGFILASTLVYSADLLLNAVNTKIELFADSKTYLQVIAVSLFFVAISNVITASLRSYGFAKYITMVVMVANVLNIFGNYVLINGHWGFPRLGVYGAALSTLGVRGLMMFVYFILLLKVLKVSFKDIRLDISTSKQIFKIGLPSAAESWTYTLMQGIILSMINSLGPDFTTARTYINTILTYIYIFSVAFASANAVMTGYYIGERNYEKAHKETLKTVFRSFIVVLSMTLVVNLSSGFILNIFTENEIIIKTVRNILWLAILLEFGRSLNLILIQALRSAGDTTFPLVMAVLSMFGIAVTSAYFFGIHLGLGLFGIYMAFVFDEVFRGILMFFRWQSRKWETKSSYLENTE
ncbi:MAG: MATE family efflux transporter [Acholeplasmataceae bacterium]|nr:MATE family efflux transporter [Acholeplasmataceae bacterium]